MGKKNRAVGLGLDVGGTNIAGALVDEAGCLLEEYTLPTESWKGPEAVMERVLMVAGHLFRQAAGRGLVVRGIGMGVPGPLESGTGLVLHAPNLGWHDLPVKKIVQQHFSAPVFVENDVRCAALGEKFFGAGRGVEDLICVALGTGVGAGIFVAGSLLRGSGDIAGEIGHICLDPNGPPCNCGRRGCLEVYAGAAGIARRAREAIQSGKQSVIAELVGGKPELIDPAVLSRAAGQGDRLALEIWRETGELVGWALATAVTLLNPRLVIVGGGVARAGEVLLGPMRDTLCRRAMPEHARQVEVVSAHLGERAGVIGAASLAWKNISGACR
ncbi:MAG: ROK family protein [Desulfurispora sp.]|uniref:ROK family protein n=1 Tax=Desulfurispora sp. TaxID=3014275 RepID=UPI00404AC625